MRILIQIHRNSGPTSKQSLYEENPNQFSDLTLTPKYPPNGKKMNQEGCNIEVIQPSVAYVSLKSPYIVLRAPMWIT